MSCIVGWLGKGYAADATQPVDYTQRNVLFAPSDAVEPTKTVPSLNIAVQDRRIEPATIPLQSAAIGERRAAIDVQEAGEKSVLKKDSHRPSAAPPMMSAFDHREAPLTSGAIAKKPERVARYQDSLAAASASNLARFPAIGPATTAKFNRFVFRKNPPDPATGLDAPVIPAASDGAGSPAMK